VLPLTATFPKKNMSVKLAVFDMAGTTIMDDGYVANAFRNAFLKNGYHVSLEDTHPYMGVKKINAVKMMLEKLGEPFTESDAEEIHSDFVAEMIDFYEYDLTVKQFDDTEEVFRQLKDKGVRIVLNTGFPKVIADAIVNRFQWIEKNLVDDYIASDEVLNGRPASYMIDQLMYRAGIDDPMLVAKVGDTSVDIEEGQNAGCGYVIAVTTGSGSREELSSYHPTHIVDHLSEIPAILY
jgi:phosphonatase-like hydrolase